MKPTHCGICGNGDHLGFEARDGRFELAQVGLGRVNCIYCDAHAIYDTRDGFIEWVDAETEDRANG
jgi:hypothetical protein